ncbi:MAG: choice-of-anchor B family protein [Gemmatimonadetes bacterium]|nr:MAG: choice-of-anchor B family protein [Gemmatimonadota bacterium]
MNIRTTALLSAALGLVLAAPGGVAAQGYGAAVAVGDGEVFVAEPLNTSRPGYIYVYRPGADGAWQEAQKLEASDAAPNDHFGRFVEVEDGILIAGATVRSGSIGGAYVFERGSDGVWHEVQILEASDGTTDDSFGRMSARDGDRILIADWANADSRGAVYVFHRGEDGRWSEEAKLTASDAEPDDWFGMGLALEGDLALIGVPQKNGNRGAVYVFERGADGWSETGKITLADAGPQSRFGGAVALKDGTAFVAAPTENGFVGAVYVFQRDDSGAWEQQARLTAFDGGPRGLQYGTTISVGDDEIRFSAPGAAGFAGRVYVVRREGEEWTEAYKVGVPGLAPGSGFGTTMAFGGDLAVFGATGEDNGAGAAYVFRRGADGRWTDPVRIVSEMQSLDPITGEEVRCNEGAAAIFGCQDVDILSFVPVKDLGGTRGVELNDIWGWTDPETGREYALVGRTNGTSFVDVTDPLHPRFVADLPLTEGAVPNAWRDIKVYNDHAFIVADGAGPHGMQVFDLRRLRDMDGPEPVTVEADALYTGIASAHNIVINEASGFAYAVGANSGGETCGGGLHMIDIRDPLSPEFAGCFQDTTTGRQLTGYSHDAQCVTYHGPDPDHQGAEVCFGANETALSIADVTDKTAPVAIATATYPNVGYTHQGWLDEEQRYFYMDDELDELGGNVEFTRTLIWDVSDLDDPVLVKEYFHDNRASDHNLYIKGDLMYQSNYVSGLRVLDISDRENPRLVGYLDTVPWGEDAPGFDGSWSNYPFFQSGIVVVTSGKEGLFVVRKRETRLVP